MSEKDWTPEPWAVYPNPMREDGVFIGTESHTEERIKMMEGERISKRPDVHIATHQVLPSDGHRIVSCVNGCESIPRPEGLGELVKAVNEVEKIIKEIANFAQNTVVLVQVKECVSKIESALRALGIEVE